MEASKSSNFKKYNSKNPFIKLTTRIFLESINDWIRSVSPQRILDVGCGEGFVIKYLLCHNEKISIIGVDNSKESLEFARKINPGVELILGDIYNMPFLNKNFDLVICLEVLEHLDEVPAALVQLRRLTNRYCLLSVPCEPYFSICHLLGGKNISRFGRHPEHVHYFTRKKICKIIENYFNIRKTGIFFPWILILGEI